MDLRRDFELIKELDRMNIALTAELRGIEAQYLNRLSKNRAYADAKVTQKMEALRERIHRRHVEKTSIGRNMLSELERFLRKMDVDLAFFETELRNSGTGGDLFEQAKLSIEPGSDVAVRVSSTSDDYILGRVIFYNVETSIYDIADADESSSKRYSVPESSVILLDLDYNQTVRRLAKGEAVLAVYPETTSFYPALVTCLFFFFYFIVVYLTYLNILFCQVVQAPRKAALNMEPTVVVQFNDDHDESGTIPHKTVLLRHVARIPPAA